MWFNTGGGDEERVGLDDLTGRFQPCDSTILTKGLQLLFSRLPLWTLPIFTALFWTFSNSFMSL